MILLAYYLQTDFYLSWICFLLQLCPVSLLLHYMDNWKWALNAIQLERWMGLLYLVPLGQHSKGPGWKHWRSHDITFSLFHWSNKFQGQPTFNRREVGSNFDGKSSNLARWRGMCPGVRRAADRMPAFFLPWHLTACLLADCTVIFLPVVLIWCWDDLLLCCHGLCCKNRNFCTLIQFCKIFPPIFCAFEGTSSLQSPASSLTSYGPGGNHLTSLCLSVLICKMGTKMWLSSSAPGTII